LDAHGRRRRRRTNHRQRYLSIPATLDVGDRVGTIQRTMHRTIEHPAIQPLKTHFPNAKLLAGEFRDMVTVVVLREHLVDVATFLRDESGLRYDFLSELNGVGYLNV